MAILSGTFLLGSEAPRSVSCDEMPLGRVRKLWNHGCLE